MYRKKTKVRAWLFHWWKQLMLLALILLFIAGSLFLIWVITLDIPSFDSFDARQVTESTKIYDRTGKIVLYDVYGKVKRQVVPFADISKDIKNATVAIEDSEFYQHRGVKPTAILRAFIVNLTSGATVQGGSTITQQLVKNALLTQDRTIARKIKELVLSLKLERIKTKEEILTLYLNENPYGGNIYGVEEAAQTFFGKSASEVDLAEAAYVAAVAKAPTYYSPYGQHRDKLDNRKNVVLSRMRELGFITTGQEETAKKEKIVFQSGDNDGSIKAPHFVMYVRDYLEQKYGEEAVKTKGYKVITTLDWAMQQKAETMVKQYGDENAKKFKADNAGLVAIDPKTGQILAMVGSRDYFDLANQGNFNVTLAHRQPGSAFKPFVYATAFEKGFTPDTVVFDLPTQFDATCRANGTNCYSPSNYDGNFRGPMKLRDALAQSINLPAIKVLYLAGIKDSINTARKMGIESLADSKRYGLSLVLGGGEVSLLDMVSAYSVFANEGTRNPKTPILKMEDSQGNVLEEFKPSSTEVLPPNIAREISDIISDDKARAPIFGANSALNIPGRQVAVKTGTTNDYKDAWIIGYTPSISVGAWVGNNANTSMDRKVAGMIVAPLWNTFMKEILVNYPVETFTRPDPVAGDQPPYNRGHWQGGKSYFTDKISGKIATEYTPTDLREEHIITQIHSILYWLDRTDESQFQLWEGPVRAWATARGLVDQSENNIPTATDDVHLPQYAPNFSIIAPASNVNFNPSDRVTVKIGNYQGKYPLAQLDIFADDQYLGSVQRAPYEFSFPVSDLNEPKPNGTIRAIVYDQVRNKTEQTVSFKLNVLSPDDQDQ